MKPELSNGLHSVDFGRGQIEFRLKHTKRKTLAITVQPDASVAVTAPRWSAIEAVKAKVRKRAIWIRRQQRFFLDYLPPTPPRRYVSGETHRYLGRQYRLKVMEGPGENVKLKGRFIHVVSKRRSDTEQVRALLESWYLARARSAFERSLALVMGRLSGLLGREPQLMLRRMAKRWGSWTKRGVIYLNPELIKVPPSCIEYVIIHELCHQIHANHSKQFYALLRRLMPDWELRKARLEGALRA